MSVCFIILNDKFEGKVNFIKIEDFNFIDKTQSIYGKINKLENIFPEYMI